MLATKIFRRRVTSARCYTTRASGLSATARSKAEHISANWKGTSLVGGTTKNYIGGEFVESKTEKWIELHDPVCLLFFTCPLYPNASFLQSTQTLLSRVPETTSHEFEQAVDAASQAFKTWSRTSVITRQRFAIESVSNITIQRLDYSYFWTDFSIYSVNTLLLLQTVSFWNKAKLWEVRFHFRVCDTVDQLTGCRRTGRRSPRSSSCRNCNRCYFESLG